MSYAAMGGNVQVMRYLLDGSGDPAMPDETGSTPLHNAAEGGTLPHSSVDFIEGIYNASIKILSMYTL